MEWRGVDVDVKEDEWNGDLLRWWSTADNWIGEGEEEKPKAKAEGKGSKDERMNGKVGENWVPVATIIAMLDASAADG